MGLWIILRRQRLRLLGQDLANDLRRNRDAFIVLLSLVPLGPKLIGWPFAVLGHGRPDAPLEAAIACVVLIACAALWAHVFRRTIGGGAFHAYLRSLPIPRGHLRRLDSLALLATNLPLWLAACSAALQFEIDRPAWGGKLLYGGRVMLAICLCLLVQSAVLRASREAIAFALVAVLCLGLGVWVDARSLQALFVAAGAAASLAFLAGLSQPNEA